jgi:LPXTG-motif cell wall-anchored protein
MFWASGTTSQVKADTATSSEQAAQKQTNTAEKPDSTEGADQVETNNANADAGKTVETAKATNTGSQGTTMESSTASSSTQNQGQEADAQKTAETPATSQETETTTFDVRESGQGDANTLTVSKAAKTSGESTGSTPDKNGVDTTWARDKSATTGNSDSNSVTTEAGEYWPDTQNQQLKDLSGVTTTSDFTADALKGKLNDEYSGTPLAKYNRDISLYIKGQKVDPSTLTDDDSLGKQNGKNVIANPNFPTHASKGHARLIKTVAFGPDTYFFARNAVSVYNQHTGKYENYDVKWTLQSANYSVGTPDDASNAAVNSSDGTTDNQITSYGFGVKGSEDAGGNLLFNVGSGWQKMVRGNFLNTHMQLFKEVDSKVFENNENVDDAIKNGHLVATAANIHLGFSDIDSDEAVELTNSAIKKTIVSDASALAYQVTDDGYLAVTRKYGTTVGAGTGKTDKIAPKDAMVLFELAVPEQGIDVSYATVGPRTGQEIGPGSKIDPTSMTGIEYNQPLIVNYYELKADGSTTTTQLKDTETYHGNVGDEYPTEAQNPPATITTSDGTTWYLKSSMTYNSHPDDANHYKYKGGYSDATNVINYYYEKPTVVVKPGGNWPDNAQTKVDLTKNVTRTINYVDAKTNAQVADPVTQTVEFGRTAVVRKNTGELVGFDTNGDGVADVTDGDTAWAPTDANNTKWNEQASPDLSSKGYQPAVVPTGDQDATDKNSVKEVTPSYSSNDANVVVTYDKKQKATVTYIDDTTKTTLKTDSMSGDSNAKSGYTTAGSIKGYEDLGYELVKDGDQTGGKEVVFDNDSSVDQAYEVHLKHAYTTVTPENPGKPGDPINPGEGSSKYPSGTDKASLTDTVNRTITYKMSDGSTAPASVKDSLTYTASKTIDKVTGEVTDTTWSKNQDFKDVTSPDVKGYTADRATVSDKNVAHDADDISEEVKYTPENQKATVTYIDDTTKTTLKTDSMSGDSNAKSGYTTAGSIKSYEGLGYELVKDGDQTGGKEVVFDNDSSVDQAYEVHLIHAYTTVTPENPGKPGDPINPGEGSSKYPSGTDKASLTDTVNRTITYKMSDGSTAPASVKDSLTYTASKTIDKVTGEVTDTTWSKNQDFKDVTSPDVKGYTADRATVSDKNVAHDADDISEEVKYTPENQKATVTYIDDTTGKTLKTDSMSGDSNAKSGYTTAGSIKSYEDLGYELVKDGDQTGGKEVVFDNDSSVDQAYEVHLKHAYTTVTPENPVKPGDPINPGEGSSKYPSGTDKASLTDTVNRTITYKMSDGSTAPASVKDSLTYTASKTIDKVTGEVTDTTWSKNQDFKDVTSPDVKGYTADRATVSDKNVAHDADDISEEVKYTPENQKATVTYIDDTTGKTLKTDSMSGDSNAKSGYTTAGSIKSYEDLGYELVKDGDQTGGKEVVFDNDSSVDQAYEVHLKHTYTTVNPKVTGKQTVTYVFKDKDGNVVKTNTVTTDTSSFTGKSTKDEVTDKTTTVWDHDSQAYSTKETPVEQGYTADKKSVGGDTVTPDDPNRSYTVVYTPNGSVVPVDPNGSPIPGTNPVSYETDPTDPTKVVDGKVPGVDHWTPKNGQPGDPVTPKNPTEDTKVPYDHTKTTSETAAAGKQTVTYVYKDKDGKVVKSETVTTDTSAFKGTTTKDEVTGETKTDWDHENQKYSVKETPVVQGYTADKKSVGGDTVTPDDPNRSYTVVYTPNGSVVPVDPNGKQIPGTNPVPYETDPTDPTKVVDGKVPGVDHWTPKNGKPGDPVTPKDPTKDTEVPYVHTMTPAETTVTGKQTVTYFYKDKDGKVVKTKTVEEGTATFTGKTSKDEVTGENTTAWDQKDHQYTEVKTPVEPGYTASDKSVGGETVTPADPNRSYEVVYTPNGSVLPIDPNGNPIPNTPSVPYETDPNDPTKVVDGKVPEVPNWTPKEGQPGDPVTPTDPTKDTEVPYDHTKTPGETKVDGKQTVTYVYKDGKVVKTKTVEEGTTFTGKTTKDEATGKTTTTWDQKDHQYTEVKTPVEPGYTADKKSVGGETVTPDDPNRSYEVVYTPNGHVVPVDPNGNPIPNTPSVPYETDPNDPTKVVDSKVPEVPSWTPKEGQPGDRVVPTNPTKDTEVPYDHTKTPGETKVDGKQTVTYVYKDKDGKVVKTKTIEETTTFTGKTTKDEATGETITTWEQKNHTYNPENTPVVPGYTADKKSVGGETVTPDDPNRSYTVVYTPNGHVVPVDPDGTPIPNTPSVPYETDPNDPTKVVDGKVPEVPSWTPKEGQPGDPVVPTNPTKDTEVPYDHTMTPGETKVDGKQTVTYVYKDKDDKVVKTKTVEEGTTFTGTTSKDEVTGKTTTTWDQKDHQYAEVTTPVEPGYTADKKSVGGETVTPDDPNRSYTVTYTQIKSDKPTTPETKPTEPETKPTTPETKPTEPETKPTTPETKPTEPETKPTTPETKPTEPETKPTTPETKPTEPETKPTEPETKPTTPETKPTKSETKPKVKPTKSKTEPTKPKAKPLVRKTKSDPAHPNAGQLNGRAKTPSEPVTPGTPTLNGAGLTNADGNGIGSANSVKTAAGDAKLPQTGAKESPAAVAAGLIALGMSAALGLASLRKKRH